MKNILDHGKSDKSESIINFLKEHIENILDHGKSDEFESIEIKTPFPFRKVMFVMCNNCKM